MIRVYGEKLQLFKNSKIFVDGNIRGGVVLILVLSCIKFCCKGSGWDNLKVYYYF